MRTSTPADSPRLSALSRRSRTLVLGCGWLGLPLAKKLLSSGHEVLGTTTSPEQLGPLRQLGIDAHLLRLGPDFDVAGEALLLALLRRTDVLVLNVPPRASAAGGYPALLRPVHHAVAAAGTSHVLFVSSTSVYPDAPHLMREPDALSTRDAASDVLRAEGHFVPRYGQWQSTVARLSGLMGPGRSPGRFLAGRQNLPNGSAPVNLLHLTDAVGTLAAIIQQNVWGHTLNVCANTHPLKRDFYPAAARFLGLEPPTFLAENAGGKIVDSSLLRELVPYQFQHDNVLEALRAC